MFQRRQTLSRSSSAIPVAESRKNILPDYSIPSSRRKNPERDWVYRFPTGSSANMAVKLKFTVRLMMKITARASLSASPKLKRFRRNEFYEHGQRKNYRHR